MKSRLLIQAACAATAVAMATPAAAVGDANAGLQALRELNLIVLGDWRAGHDVEGKTFIGGNAGGNSATLGIGNGQQGAATSSRATLTVVGDNSINNINLNNGSNGSNGRVATRPGALIGGSSKGINLNAAGATLDVGGNLQGNYNVGSGQTFTIGGNLTNGGINGSSGAVVKVGGRIEGSVNANGAVVQQNLGTGFNSGITGAAATEAATLRADLGALSAALGNLAVSANPSSISFAGSKATFNAVDNGAGFAVFNVDRSIFSYGSFDYNFTTLSPVIINVYDATTKVFNYAANPVGGNVSAKNGQVIWNFVDATEVNFLTMVHGSVLALAAKVSNNTPIEGSVAVGEFNQGGEVHLGTYAGGDFLPEDGVGPIPEPASWMMLIAGFGLTGAAMRRRAGRPATA